MEHYASLMSIYLDAPCHSVPLFIEARLQRGLPRCQINGLSAGNSRETAERIRNAIHASGVQIPYMNLAVNLSPADIRKSGPYLDVSIAVCILLALKENLSRSAKTSDKGRLEKILYLGELSLSGRILPVPHLYTLVWEARKQGFNTIFLPQEQACLAQIIPDIRCIPLKI